MRDTAMGSRILEQRLLLIIIACWITRIGVQGEALESHRAESDANDRSHQIQINVPVSLSALQVSLSDHVLCSLTLLFTFSWPERSPQTAGTSRTFLFLQTIYVLNSGFCQPPLVISCDKLILVASRSSRPFSTTLHVPN
jgi:hypothetical protein